MARRHRLNVFSLSFLDAMTCGLGAVVLLFMVINASVQIRSDRLTEDLQAEVDRREQQVLDGHLRLVELRNSLRRIEQDIEVAGTRRLPGSATRVIDGHGRVSLRHVTVLARADDVSPRAPSVGARPWSVPG